MDRLGATLKQVVPQGVRLPEPQTRPVYARSLRQRPPTELERVAMLEEAGVPPLLLSKKARPASLDKEMWARLSREVVPVKSGLFYGKPGTGKSYAAASVLWQLQEAEKAVSVWEGAWNHDDEVYEPRFRFQAKWVSVPVWMHELRKSMGRRDREDERDPIRDIMGREILVLDDLAAEYATGWSAEQLFLVVDARINEMKPLIVTTNLSLSELNDRDARLASRLMSLPRIPFEGKDRRFQ